ncbi:hypothetical protein [Azospirillum endophyticum]
MAVRKRFHGSSNDFTGRQIQHARHQNVSEVVSEADLEAEQASLAIIDDIACRGVAAIERGDFRLVQGEEGRSDFLADLMSGRIN